MNKKGNLLGQVILFLGLWLISSLVWSIWLDGIWNPLAGVLTSALALGLINITINFNR